MIGYLVEATVKESLGLLRSGLFYVQNKRDVDAFVEAKASCEDCQRRGVCPDHLEEAQEVFFTDV